MIISIITLQIMLSSKNLSILIQKRTPGLSAKTLIIFIAIFIPLSLILFILTFSIVRENRNSFLDKLKHNEDRTVADITSFINNDFNDVLSYLRIIGESSSLIDYLNSIAISPEICAKNRERAEYDFLLFSKNRGIYDQIRFIDITGMERIRINYNNGNPLIVPDKQLQEKRNRYYFTDTINLKKAYIYVSPFDLNIEHGKIEKPYKPMIRFATPVFNSAGEKKGIVILNYLGDRLIKELIKKGEDTPVQYMLLNRDGYWIYHRNPKLRWGFIHDNRKNVSFKVKYPDEWSYVLSRNSGQIETRNGIFTFKKLFPLKSGELSSTGSPNPFSPSAVIVTPKEYFWCIVSLIPHENYSRILPLKYYVYLLPISIILTGILIWILSRLIVNRIYMANELNKLSQAVEQSTNIVVISDLEGNIEYVNRRYETATGFPKDTLLGKKMWRQPIIHFPADIIRTIIKHLTSGTEWDGEVKVKRTDKSILWAKISVSPIIDKRGSPAYYLSIITDITENKERENTITLLNKRLKKDLDIAVNMQRSLLPAPGLSLPGIRFSYLFEPSEEVAGDIFNIFKLDEENVGFYILDVCGHGLSSAMLSVTLSRILTPFSGYSGLLKTFNDRKNLYKVTPPAEVAAVLNKRFQFTDESDQFFTILYGIFNLKRETFRYISAGHPGFVYADSGGKLHEPDIKGFPIGFTENPVYDEHVIRVERGSRFFFFSDGLTELSNSNGQPLGINGIKKIIEETSSLETEKVPGLLVREAKKRTETGKALDDISCVVIEII